MTGRDQFVVETLGALTVDSPLDLSRRPGDGYANYVPDDTRVLYTVSGRSDEDFSMSEWMQRSGPREKIFFDPSKTRAAIVTCGGLSPGLNNVIRSIYFELHHKYRVAEVLGFRYGYRGMNPANGDDPVVISPEFVRTIHNEGGSVLGTSRGAEDPELIADQLEKRNIDILFCIGGEGTLRGARAIWHVVSKRGLCISVVGVPKTIDNDIPYVYKTFGFDTAIGVVRQAIDGAHVEAVSAPNGIGLVKVMGRDSGFIAAYGTLASMEVNFCLVPEVEFDLEGPGGFLDCLERRVVERGHAVIVAAEGAGQDFFADKTRETDASGNRIHKDIGLYLKDKILGHFDERRIVRNMKYIDPSYMIRSCKANASDAIFCDNLSRNAVHAAMAGKTDVVIGLWHGVYVNLPISLVVDAPKKMMQPESYLWRNVVGATGQPMDMRSTD